MTNKPLTKMPKTFLTRKKFGAGRLVFVCAFRKFFTEFSLLCGFQKVLYSYMDARSNLATSVVPDVFRQMAPRSLIYMDSGVFSLYKQLNMPKYGGRPYDIPAPVLQQLRRDSLARKKEFVRYTLDYIEFLNHYDKEIGYAFEMDVDIFAGVKLADDLYSLMRKRMRSREKIIRVWHHTRTFDDWTHWCDEQPQYLAVEGANTHGRDTEFYQPFIEYAHKRGVKVHVLALTTPHFMSQVACDTADSSSWTQGGRYGNILLPDGRPISFGRKGGKRSWRNLSPAAQADVLTWLAEGGLRNLLPSVLAQQDAVGYQGRMLVNAYYYRRHVDIPVAEVRSRRTTLIK